MKLKKRKLLMFGIDYKALKRLNIVKTVTEDDHIKAIGTVGFVAKIESMDDNFFEDGFKDGDMDANFEGRDMGTIIFKDGIGARRGEQGWATPAG